MGGKRIIPGYRRRVQAGLRLEAFLILFDETDGGSVFLRQLATALDPQVIKKIQHPDEPLPLEALAPVVSKGLENQIAAELKEKQTPRLAGHEDAERSMREAAAQRGGNVLLSLYSRGGIDGVSSRGNAYRCP